MNLFKKCLMCALALSFVVLIPVYAKEAKPVVTVRQQINSEDMPEGISFIVQKELSLSESKVVIPEKSTVYAYIINAQDARRWHKSGFIICKLKGYTVQGNADEKNLIDIEDKEIYMVARKYKPIDKKELGKTAVEVTATTAAGIIVPGVDIAYYFTKGMINKQEGKTRFKSGVSSAYENSIFWFWLKGKPIDLEENASISFTQVSKEKA